MSVFLQPIYTQVVGAGGASSITFNNIPQGFTDLKFVISVRSSSSGGDAIAWRYNGDSSSSYSNVRAFTDIAGIYSDKPAGTNVTPLYANIPTSSNTANTFSNTEIYIANYNNGLKKSYQADVTSENVATTAYLMFIAGSYQKQDPITSITFFTTNTANFVQYSSITLYGISSVYDVAKPVAPTIGTPVDLGGVLSIPFTPNDSIQGQTADNYSITTVPSTSTFYTQGSPSLVTTPTLGQSYTTSVSANNSQGSNASSASSSIATHNNYASIATYSITSNTSNIVFTNIPQYYSHLQLRLLFRDSAAFTERSFFIEVNGNSPSSSNSLHYILGNGSSVSSSGSINQGRYASPAIPASSATSNVFGTVIGDLLEYANTSKFKTFRFFGGFDANGSGSVWLSSYTYASVSPVTALNIYTNSQMLPGCSVALYGIG